MTDERQIAEASRGSLMALLEPCQSLPVSSRLDHVLVNAAERGGARRRRRLHGETPPTSEDQSVWSAGSCPVSLSCPPVQTATDSSSNSSQRREPLATPHFCEARRHQCILGHFYEQHWPSEHHFLNQVSQRTAARPQPPLVCLLVTSFTACPPPRFHWLRPRPRQDGGLPLPSGKTRNNLARSNASGTGSQ